jgi:hypothetical protein
VNLGKLRLILVPSEVLFVETRLSEKAALNHVR